MKIKTTLAFLSVPFLATSFIAIHSAQAQTRPVDCELVVEGVSKIKGRCDFETTVNGNPGSFQIRKGTDQNGLEAQINITAPGVADAVFLETTAGEVVATPYEGVRRNGSCWANAEIKVCARALTAAPARAKAPAKASAKAKAPSKAN